MPEIMALACPVCAAPLPGRDAEQCQYCGSIVFIKPDLPQLSTANLNRSVINQHIAQFRQRIRTNSYDEEAHYGLGVAYYNLGLTDSAIDELTKAANLMPENVDIRYQLATVYFESDDPSHRAQAKRHISTILTLKPGHEESIRMMAHTLLGEGDIHGARRLANQLSSPDRDLSARIQGRIATEHLFNSDIDAARNVLHGISEDVVRQSMLDFIRSFRTPIYLVSAKDPGSPFGCTSVGLGIVLLLALFGSLTSEGETSVGAVVFLVVVLLVLGVYIRGRYRLYQDHTVNSTYAIPAEYELIRVSTADLLHMAGGLVRYQRGELVTPEEKALLNAQQE